MGLDDFVVTANGRELEVLDVHVADYPIALLLDDTQDDPLAGTVRAAAVRFVERIGERPLAVATLSSPTRLVASFDDERADVVRKLKEAPLRAARPAALLPVVANAADAISALDTPFSAIVVITATAIDRAENGDGRRLPAILESHAVVHVVALRGGPASPETGPPADLFKVLADQTRGQYTAIFNAASFTIALDRLADRLSSEMMVSVLSTPGAAGDVRVGVKKPGLRVLGLGVSK